VSRKAHGWRSGYNKAPYRESGLTTANNRIFLIEGPPQGFQAVDCKHHCHDDQTNAGKLVEFQPNDFVKYYADACDGLQNSIRSAQAFLQLRQEWQKCQESHK